MFLLYRFRTLLIWLRAIGWPAIAGIAFGALVGAVASCTVVFAAQPVANPHLPPLDLSALENGADKIPLNGHIWLFRDKTGGRHQAANILLRTGPDPFHPLPGELALGYTSDVVWARVTLSRAGLEDPGRTLKGLQLMISPIYLDRVDIYIPKVARPRTMEDFTHLLRGDYFPAEQQGTWHPFLTVPLTLPALESAQGADETTIYFRIDSGSSVSLRASVVTPAAFTDAVVARTAFAIALCVMSLMAMLLNLFFWVQSRRRYFLSFAFLMFANGSLVIGNSGFLFLNQYALSGYWNNAMVEFQVLLTIFANLLFVYDQVSARRFFSHLGVVFKVLLSLNAAAFVTAIVEGPAYSIVVGPLLLAAAAAIIVLFIGKLESYLRTRRPGSLAALLAASVQLVFGVIDVLFVLGGPDVLGIGENAYWVATAPFTLLMSASMIQRARHLETQRKVAMGLRVSRRAEKQALALVETRTRELKRAKETAEAALDAERRMQSEQLRFVDIIRHQYQTPLAVIRSSAATLAKTLPREDEDNRNRVKRIQLATTDLVEVMQVSLERSRIQETPSEAKRREVPLHPFLSSLITRAQTLHDDHRLELVITDIEDHRTALLDDGMIAIALTNLIDNAIKFSPAGSTVRLSARRDGMTLTLNVSDEGIGVPENEKAQVAKRYFRASNTGNVKGTGLGLSIVAHVTSAHDGAFALENREPRGARATLVFPGAFGRQ